MVKPTFICIGVQKGGTTSLINYLSSHPDIYMNPSEPHFFDKPKDYIIIQDDINKYEALFDTNKLIAGEKTPSYNYLQFAIDRIYNYNPNIKLILILREPITRAFSQYNMYLNYFNKTLNDVNENDMHEYFIKNSTLQLSELKINDSNIVVRGFYDEIITYILSKFSKNNLYIGIAEEIKLNKLYEYNKIINFLGMTQLNNINNMDANIRKYEKNIPQSLKEYLYKIYKPHNENLYNILGRRIDIWEQNY